MNPEQTKKKKLTEGLILGGLLLALIIVVIVQFTGAKPVESAPPAAPGTQPPADQNAAAPAEATNELAWIDDRRVAGILYEVQYGRDPFENLMQPVVAAIPPVSSGPISTPPGGTLPGPYDPPIDDNVDFGPYDGSGDIDEPAPPAPPPPPNFVLSGVVKTPSAKYVAITIDGNYYTLREGETVPGYQWTVDKIAIDQVVLIKDTQSLTLRLSGGSPK